MRTTKVINAAKKDVVNPAKSMADFIHKIKEYASSLNPGFIIIQQNASTLGIIRPETFNTINAVSQECISYTVRC